MTTQEIFDRVTNHLYTQKCSAFSEEAGCRYRMEDGRKCAVGCLIPDEFYDKRIEGFAVSSIDGDEPINNVLRKAGLSDHKELLRDLQNVHDGYMPEFVEDWKDDEEIIERRLKSIAEKYKLTFNPPY